MGKEILNNQKVQSTTAKKPVQDAPASDKKNWSGNTYDRKDSDRKFDSANTEQAPDFSRKDSSRQASSQTNSFDKNVQEFDTPVKSGTRKVAPGDEE